MILAITSAVNLDHHPTLGGGLINLVSTVRTFVSYLDRNILCSRKPVQRFNWQWTVINVICLCKTNIQGKPRSYLNNHKSYFVVQSQ